MNKNILYAASLEELLGATGGGTALAIQQAGGDSSSATETHTPIPQGGTTDGSAPNKAELPGLEIEEADKDTPNLMDNHQDHYPDPEKPDEDSDEDSDEVDPKKGKVSDDDFGDRLKDKTASKKDDKKGSEKQEKEEPEPTPRDYSGFQAEEVELLKKMGNKTFAFVAPIIKEYKQLKPQIEALKSDLEAAKKSPPADAYVDKYGYAEQDTFKQAHAEVEQAQGFVDFYNQQLISLETTDSFVGLVLAPDGKSYQQVPIKCKDANEAATYKVQLLDIINSNRMRASQGEQRKEQIRQQYQGNVTQSRAVIDNVNKKAFSKYIGKESENPYITTMKRALGERGHANNPLADTVAYMYASIQELTTQLAKAVPPKPAAGVNGTPANGTTTQTTPKGKPRDPSSASVTSSNTAGAAKGKPTFIKDEELAGRFGG